MTAFSPLTAVGTRVQSAAATSLSPGISLVTGIGTAGLLILSVLSKNNATHSVATAGWTKLLQTNSGASFTSSVFIAKTGAAAPTVTWTGSVACAAQIICIGDPNGVMTTSIGNTSSNTGSGATHSSASITTTRADSIAIYVDTCSANTALATPANWIEITDTGSATGASRTVFGYRPLNTAGSTSGAISVTGGAAAWVQFQIELRFEVTSGLESSKIEVLDHLQPDPGLSMDRMEVIDLLEPAPGLTIDKMEILDWMEPDLNTLQVEFSQLHREIMWATTEPPVLFAQVHREILRSTTPEAPRPYSRTIKLTYLRD